MCTLTQMDFKVFLFICFFIFFQVIMTSLKCRDVNLNPTRIEFQRTRTQDKSAKCEMVPRIAEPSRSFGKIKKAADMFM